MATVFSDTKREIDAYLQANRLSAPDKALSITNVASGRIKTPTGPQHQDGTDFPAAYAIGQIVVASAPANNDTITIGGKTYTFVAANPTTNQLLNTGTTAQIAQRIADKVNADNATTLVEASVTGSTVNFRAWTFGTAGNSIALTTDGTHITKTAFAGGID